MYPSFSASSPPPRLTLRRSGPRTGLRVGGCYAGALEDCGGKLSAEHYVPEGVIRMLADAPVAHATGRPVVHGVGSMKARVLCQRHNESLSKLDELAKALVRTVRAAHRDMPRSIYVAGDTVQWFHGDDVGRVLLKTLCAAEAGAVWKGGSSPPRGWMPPDSWLRVLFHDAPWPDGWGLRVPVMRRGEDANGAGMTFGRRVTQDGTLVAVEMEVAGFTLLLALADLPDGGDWGNERWESVQKQPARVVMHTDGCEKAVHFVWERPNLDLTINHRFAR